MIALIIRVITWAGYVYQIGKLFLLNWKATDPIAQKQMRDRVKEAYNVAKINKDPSAIFNLINHK